MRLSNFRGLDPLEYAAHLKYLGFAASMGPMRALVGPVLVVLSVLSCSPGVGSEAKCANDAKAPAGAESSWSPSAGVPPVSENPKRASDASEVPIELTNVSVPGAAELIAKRTNERVAIDVLAMPTATCTRVNAKLGGGAKIGDVLDALEASLSGTGLGLERGKGSHRIVRVAEPTLLPTDCTISDAAYHQWVIAGIRKIDATTVEIKRAHLKLWSEHFFRFYPSTEDPPRGKKGFILVDRRNFETPAAVGAKNGDLLVAIQGEPLAWSADISAISSKVVSADTVTIDIVRGGKPMKLTLRVVP